MKNLSEFKQEFNLERDGDVPYIHNTKELKLFLKNKYIIEDMIKDIETYNKELNKLRNIVRSCYPIYECRTYPIEFRLSVKSRKKYTLELRHFYIMFILWRPFVEVSKIKDVVKEEYIIYDYKKMIPNIDHYIGDYIINTLREYHLKSTKINYSVADLLQNLIQIDIDFGLLLGLNFTLKTFMDLYMNNPRIREIMEVKFEDGMQPYEIENILDNLEREAIDILENEEENPIGIILSSGTGIKHKQLTEFMISEGLNPSLDGKTIPKVIENSTLIGGLDRPSYLFLGGTGARKSMVAQKKTMGKAGHFAKIVLMLVNTLAFSLNKSDCGTTHLMPYQIKTKKHLDKLDGKYFKESLTDEYLDILVAKDRRDLVGKTIYVRNVAMCCLGENECCHTCIGVSSSFSIDIRNGLSGYLSEEITQHVQQNILSTSIIVLCQNRVTYWKNLSNCWNILRA